MPTKKQCISDIYMRPDGLPNLILQCVQNSRLRRLNLPIPQNTIQIATKLKLSYLGTLYHLKQLELEGVVRRVDYYPNPFALFIIALPQHMRLEWLRRCQLKMFDPTAGKIYYEPEDESDVAFPALRPRTPNDFSLWVATGVATGEGGYAN